MATVTFYITAGSEGEIMLSKTKTVLFLVTTLLLAACGLQAVSGFATREPGLENSGATSVEVRLTEFAIKSSVTVFKVGVPYTFNIENAGHAGHEWLIMPRGEGDETMALIAAGRDQLGSGEKASVEYTFDRTGEFEMACHVGRHYQSGMVIPIIVSE